MLTNGRVTWDSPHAFRRELKQLGDGISIVATVKPMSAANARSLKALGYYWGVVLQMAEAHTGQPADDIHEAMVERFVPQEHKRVEFVNKLTGECIPIEVEARHSPKQGGAFFDFVENVRQFLREFLQLDTPDPDPEYWRKRASVAA